jgi:hypothetical protein
MNIENSRDDDGRALQGSADLRTNACSLAGAPGVGRGVAAGHRARFAAVDGEIEAVASSGCC